jgi:hypothetical protein
MNENSQATLSATFAQIKVNVDTTDSDMPVLSNQANKVEIKLRLWDTPGD